MAGMFTDFPQLRMPSTTPPPPGAVGGNASASTPPFANMAQDFGDAARAIAGPVATASAQRAATDPNLVRATGALLVSVPQTAGNIVATGLGGLGAGAKYLATNLAAGATGDTPAAPAAAAPVAPAAAAPVQQPKSPALTPMTGGGQPPLTPAATYTDGVSKGVAAGGTAKDIAGQLTQAGMRAQGNTGSDPLAEYFAQLPRFMTAQMMGEFSRARGINTTTDAMLGDLQKQRQAYDDAAAIKQVTNPKTGEVDMEALAKVRQANISKYIDDLIHQGLQQKGLEAATPTMPTN